MSVGTKLLKAAAGGASDPVYVDDLFSTTLYDGTGASLSIVNGLDLSGEGGLIWTKTRTSATDHALMDTARGVAGTGGFLESNTTNAAETGFGSDYGPTAYNNNGYTLGSSGSPFNANGVSYCSWTFRKQSKFFDIVTYTGNGSNGGGSGRAIAHNLDCQPGMIIVKRTDNTGEWFTANLRADGAQYEFCRLNANNSKISNDLIANVANSTHVIVDGTSNGGGGSFANLYGGAQAINASGATYVMYLFGHNEQEFGEDSDEAIIKCDSFTTDGNGDAAITVGFEPQWLLIKRTDQSNSWWIADSMRGLVAKGAGGDAYLNPDQNAAEDSTYTNYIYPTATGFEMDAWGSSGTYIYMAIARPHKPASEFSATDLFTLQAKSPGEGADTFISTGFNVDTVIYRSRATSPTSLGDRLRGQSGGGDFLTNSTDAEGTNAGAFFLDDSNGVTVDYAGGHFNISPAATDKNYIRYFLRRAKGFYDVVAYAGTGSARTITHNLGVVPEFMIAKSRTESQPWVTYDAANGATKYARLESQNAVATYSGIWNDTAPTSSVFSTGGDAYINKSGHNYIIYLFATVAGISKVGSYTGTGSDLNVDCGFSAGARFVLIKRTDSTGDWYLYDSARGIVAGNDPYVFLNATDAEVTNTDYIDPLSSGFTITSSAPAGLNASSGTYIFLAIA